MMYWVLDGSAYPAGIKETQNSFVFSNGLVRREIAKTTSKTISFENLQNGVQLIDTPFADFEISVNGKKHSACVYKLVHAEEAPCAERVAFHKTDTMTADGVYPPPGKALLLHYAADGLPAVVVRYEIYDGMPVMMKCLTVQNSGKETMTVDNIAVDVMKITNNRDTLFVDSDYDSTTDFLGLDLEKYAKHYARYHYDTLEVAPLQRMNVKLAPAETLDSIVSFELLFGAEYYEQRLIEVKEMYRRIAPWCTDNVSFFHLISNSPRTIRKVVDQCHELGIEMIIQSFGSGVNMESGNERYLARIKKAYDYGHSKGIRMGAYTLAYVKNYRPVRGDEALNHDGSHICRCLATDWSKQYMKNVLRFIDRTGADAVEIDGPYGMLMCSGGKTHNHDDFTDSQYKQWKASVVDWYREIKKRGVYINAPDWHYLNGTNRSGVGYEEIAFSEHRCEQLVLRVFTTIKAHSLKTRPRAGAFCRSTFTTAAARTHSFSRLRRMRLNSTGLWRRSLPAASGPRSAAKKRMIQKKASRFLPSGRRFIKSTEKCSTASRCILCRRASTLQIRPEPLVWTPS